MCNSSPANARVSIPNIPAILPVKSLELDCAVGLFKFLCILEISSDEL